MTLLRMNSSYRSRNMPWSSRYSEDEVTVLIEEWGELYYKRHRPHLLIRYADLSRAQRRLSRPYREAILLCGMAGLSTRAAGKLVGVSHDTMWRRYRRGLRELTSYLNGGK